MKPKYRRNSSFDDAVETPVTGTMFVDAELSPEAEEAKRLLELSLIDTVGRRAVSIFLGRNDYAKVRRGHGPLMSYLLLGCLKGFAHARDGTIVFACDWAGPSSYVYASEMSIKVRDQTQCFMMTGHAFIHFPSQRVVVSAQDTPHGLVIEVRSSGDPVTFWQDWEAYTKENNVLRGQAFFADGVLIEREKKYGWDSIVVSEKTQRMIQTHVSGFLRNQPALRQLGVKARRGLILSGEPGTGKTLLGKVLAETVNASFIWVSPRHIKNTTSFEEILAIARFVSPTLIFLEDLDLFAEERDYGGGMGLGELMNQLDGAIDNEGIVTIATTNRLEVIEKALRNRPGRFDRVIEMNSLDEPCRRVLLDRLLSKAILSPDDSGHLLSVTDGYSGAQMEELVNTLYILAVERGFDGNGSGKAVMVDRPLIDAAVEEATVERKARLGFHAE